MAFEIFGYEISKKKDKAPQAAVVTPVTPRDDGASIVYSSDSGSYGAAAGYYGYQFDLDGVVRNESQMINQYRTVAFYLNRSIKLCIFKNFYNCGHYYLSCSKRLKPQRSNTSLRR